MRTHTQAHMHIHTQAHTQAHKHTHTCLQLTLSEPEIKDYTANRKHYWTQFNNYISSRSKTILEALVGIDVNLSMLILKCF